MGIKSKNKNLITFSEGITQTPLTPNRRYVIGQPLPLLCHGREASITVEASLTFPIFFFAVYMYLFMLLIVGYQDDVQWALIKVAKEAAVTNSVAETELTKSTLYLESLINEYVKEHDLSVDLSASKVMKDSKEIDLIAKYKVTLPFSFFSIKSLPFYQRVRTRAFVGVESREKEETENEPVYITETGRVYHLSSDCSYLDLSISAVLFEDLEGLRNEGGGKYKACEICCDNRTFTSKSGVYITNYGDRYHAHRICSGICRNVIRINKSEIGKRLPCSKCGKDDK